MPADITNPQIRQETNETSFVSLKANKDMKKINELSVDQLPEIFSKYASNFQTYAFDQYINYPAINSTCWIDFLFFRLKSIIETDEWTVFYSPLEDGVAIAGVRISPWDEEHFGFKLASVQIFYSPANNNDLDKYKKLLHHCIEFIRSQQVKFISVRINGDDLQSINLFETLGFRYRETIIWPVAQTNEMRGNVNSALRVAEEADLAALRAIAACNQYQRGHFHCDNGFDKNKANQLYAKWIESALKSKSKKVTVIEVDGRVAGYFASEVDVNLSNFLGYKYGRLQSLALDSKFRGQGLGGNIFSGTLLFLKNSGVEYIDSGYATKNHVSSKLHTKNNFYSVYEEVTLHFWI